MFKQAYPVFSDLQSENGYYQDLKSLYYLAKDYKSFATKRFCKW